MYWDYDGHTYWDYNKIQKSGSKGTDVVIIQKRLEELGYLTMPTDSKGNKVAYGTYGSLTQKAVKKFQEDQYKTGSYNWLTKKGIDGIVGKGTWALLGLDKPADVKNNLSLGKGPISDEYAAKLTYGPIAALDVMKDINSSISYVGKSSTSTKITSSSDVVAKSVFKWATGCETKEDCIAGIQVAAEATAIGLEFRIASQATAKMAEEAAPIIEKGATKAANLIDEFASTYKMDLQTFAKSDLQQIKDVAKEVGLKSANQLEKFKRAIEEVKKIEGRGGHDNLDWDTLVDIAHGVKDMFK